MSWLSLFRRLVRQPRRAAGRPSFRPLVDVLEDRLVPALFVESLSDALTDLVPPSIGGHVHPGPSATSGGLGTVSSSAGNVNTDTEAAPGGHAETSLAVNPLNPRNLIGVASDEQYGFAPDGSITFTAYVRAHVTFDGG